MKPPDKKEDWPYPFSKELHDKFAQVYCKPEFSKKIVDVDLMHGFLKAVNEWIDEVPLFELLVDETMMKYNEGDVAIDKAVTAIRKLLKGQNDKA